MRNQNGFIQIPLLILILAGIAVLGGASYFIIQGDSNISDSQTVAIITTDSETSDTTDTSETPVINVDNSNSTSTQNQPIVQNSIDLCTNISGTQTSIPTGMSVNGTVCSVIPPVQIVTQAPVVDVCTNIEGIQTSVPDGMSLSGTICTTIIVPAPVVDICTNIAGIQTTVPNGMTVQNGQCTTPAPQQVVTPPQNNFQTYTNNTYGFSINYPLDLVVVERSIPGDTYNGFPANTIGLSLHEVTPSGSPVGQNCDRLIIYDDNGTSGIRTAMGNVPLSRYYKYGENSFFILGEIPGEFTVRPNYFLQFGASDRNDRRSCYEFKLASLKFN